VAVPPALSRLPDAPTDVQRHIPDTLVWVYHDGVWRAGVVVSSAGPAVTVRYRLSDHGATGVDTLGWPDLAVEQRTEPDRFVDYRR
jgi:hypothetical protein